MTVPGAVFHVLVWTGIAGVTAGGLYLLIVLIREWIRKEIW
jgi:hypothetical protein